MSILWGGVEAEGFKPSLVPGSLAETFLMGVSVEDAITLTAVAHWPCFEVVPHAARQHRECALRMGHDLDVIGEFFIRGRLRGLRRQASGEEGGAPATAAAAGGEAGAEEGGEEEAA